MRKLLIAAVAAQLALLAACGGGGSNTPAPPAANVEPVTVDTGPAGLHSVNIGYVSVKICVPGTTQCQTVDHVQLDTGSSGLRILGSVLSINLPVVNEAQSGLPLAECLTFADVSSFGPVATADVVMPNSGKTVSSLAVHIIGATNYPNVPSQCPPPAENDVASFGANGILGVGPFIQDCGAGCATNPAQNVYYTCSDPASCTPTLTAVAQQVSNPVIFFSSDNNGVIVEMPTVAAGGADTVTGSLVFGIGTESNNGLGSATVLPASTDLAYISANYKGTTYPNTVIDSGSNGNFFPDSSIPLCTDSPFYCPTSTFALSATLKGTGSATAVANFTVANPDDAAQADPSITAFPGLAAPLNVVPDPEDPNPIDFDLGMPFFYGHFVFTAIEGQTAPGGPGPYYAF